MKGFLSKRIVFKVDVIQGRIIYSWQEYPCTFSAEILQAGAVKGLNSKQKNGHGSDKLEQTYFERKVHLVQKTQGSVREDDKNCFVKYAHRLQDSAY